MRFTEEHQAIRATTAKFIDAEINPHADEWEAAGIFPAHEVFRKMGALGLLGIAKPVECGGLGLDYSYQIVFSEELGRIRSGGVGTNTALPGRVPPIQFCERRSSPGCLPLPRAPSSSRRWASHSKRTLKGRPAASRSCACTSLNARR